MKQKYILKPIAIIFIVVGFLLWPNPAQAEEAVYGCGAYGVDHYQENCPEELITEDDEAELDQPEDEAQEEQDGVTEDDEDSELALASASAAMLVGMAGLGEAIVYSRRKHDHHKTDLPK